MPCIDELYINEERSFHQEGESLHYHNSKSKVKVVPALLLTEHHAIKAYWGVEV
jgi:hypothetical protein